MASKTRLISASSAREAAAGRADSARPPRASAVRRQKRAGRRERCSFDLRYAARMAAALEVRGQEDAHDVLRRLQADDALADGDDVCVVVLAGGGRPGGVPGEGAA